MYGYSFFLIWMRSWDQWKNAPKLRIVLYEKWERALFLRVAVLWGGAPAYGEVVMLCSVGLQLLQEVGAGCAVVASVLRSSVVVFLDSVRGGFKGTVSRDFLLQVFWIIFPQALENNRRVISNFFENSRRYSQGKVHQRYRVSLTHWRQILPPVPMVLLIPVANLTPVSTIPAANLHFQDGGFYKSSITKRACTATDQCITYKMRHMILYRKCSVIKDLCN